MDTALFYPDRLGLSVAGALDRVATLTRLARSLGGVLTVNWHDRSLAPERLWGAPYESMVAGWRAGGAWFPAAGEVASWFRKRRAVRFEAGHDGHLRVVAGPVRADDQTPPLTLRVYDPGSERPRDRALDAGRALDLPRARRTPVAAAAGAPVA